MGSGFVFYSSVFKITKLRLTLFSFPDQNSHKVLRVEQKPLEVMQKLVGYIRPKRNNYRQIIFDPFCGTGSTGEAALRAGFSFLGSDMDKNCVSLVSVLTPRVLVVHCLTCSLQARTRLQRVLTELRTQTTIPALLKPGSASTSQEENVQVYEGLLRDSDGEEEQSEQLELPLSQEL